MAGRQTIKNKFTVIIPSKTLCDLTKRCISKTQQLYPDIRIIVLLDVPTTLEIEAEVIAIPDLSIGEKRNYGVNLTQTPYIAFIDSDATPIQGWLENSLALLEQEHIGIVTGPNLPFPDENTEQRLVHRANLSFLVSGSTCYEKEDTFDGFTFKASSCNLLISKALYQRSGGMNPELKASEDLDLSRKVLRAGKSIYFSRGVKIFHRNRTLKGFLQQRITYGFSDAHFVRSEPSYFLTLLPFCFQFLICSGLLLGLFFAWVFILTITVLALYIIAILFESFRVGEGFKEKMKVIPYVFIGNFSPGLGTWYYLLRPHYNIYNIYENNT